MPLPSPRRAATAAATAVARLRRPSSLLSLLALAATAAILYHGVTAMDYQWRWTRVPRYFFHQRDGEWTAGILTRGLIVTLKLSLLAGLLATLIGVIAAAARLFPMASLRAAAWTYIQFMRCTPLLVQLYLLYFMFGNVLGMDRFWAGVAALAAFEGAFAAEILRAGYLSVPQAQADAANALGLARATRWRLVIAPQALPLILPPLANLFINLFKHSSIVTIIAVADLTDAARNVVSETFLAFEIWITIGGVYVAVCLPLAWLTHRWEARLTRHIRPA